MNIMPCSPLKVNRSFRGTSLPPSSTLVSCLAYSSTIKMEATYSSEKSVDFQQTTPHYIQQDRICIYFVLHCGEPG
jgi:hypothetical protein